MKKQLPSVETLRQLLDYDPETGILTWKPRPVEMFRNHDKRICATWNTRYAGKEAFGNVHPEGYKLGAIQSRYFKAHRIIWKFVTGQDPDGEIDHINGDRSDNRIANLRDVTASENQRNAGVRADNRSGAPGVFQRKNGKFSVIIQGKHCGSADTLEDAIEMRIKLQKERGFHNNHGKRKGRPKPPRSD